MFAYADAIIAHKRYDFSRLKELEGNTLDELAKQVLQDYQYFVASGNCIAKAIFDTGYQQGFSVLTKSIQIEVLDFVTETGSLPCTSQIEKLTSHFTSACLSKDQFSEAAKIPSV